MAAKCFRSRATFGQDRSREEAFMVMKYMADPPLTQQFRICSGRLGQLGRCHCVIILISEVLKQLQLDAGTDGCLMCELTLLVASASGRLAFIGRHIHLSSRASRPSPRAFLKPNTRSVQQPGTAAEHPHFRPGPSDCCWS